MGLQHEYLMHYGVLGMKWGVRRYQNRDGSLTNTGKKRQAQFRVAGEVAKKKATAAKEDAEYYKSSPEKFRKRYSGENGWKKYLDDMYGDDWHDKTYMKDVFGVSDVKKHANDQIASELKEAERESKMMYEHYIKSAEQWMRTSEKFLSTPINELSEKDFKEAEKFAKKQMKKAAWVK